MIEMKTFYGLASILMVASVVGSLWGLLLNWSILNIGGKISSISGLLFNLLLLVLFGGLYRSTPKTPKIIDNPELDKLLQEEMRGK